MPLSIFWLSNIIILSTGTIFAMWLGEKITDRGIGNGISLIIFTGIVAQLPSALVSTLELGRTGAISTLFIVFLLVFQFNSIRKTTIVLVTIPLALRIPTASSAVGGTTMDRPEWVTHNPNAPEVYAALTNNKNRGIKPEGASGFGVSSISSTLINSSWSRKPS